MEYARALLSAKEAAEAAATEAKGREEDLALFLAEADSFLLTRESKHRSRRRKDKDGRAPARRVGALCETLGLRSLCEPHHGAGRLACAV